MSIIRTEQHRARRYSFLAYIDLTAVQSEAHIVGQTRDLSGYGCALGTGGELPDGSKVSVTITHGTKVFECIGKVVYSTPDGLMGVVFIEIDDRNQAMLDDWLSLLSKAHRDI